MCVHGCKVHFVKLCVRLTARAYFLCDATRSLIELPELVVDAETEPNSELQTKYHYFRNTACVIWMLKVV